MHYWTIVLCTVVAFTLILSNSYAQEAILSPLKQIHSGIQPQDVKCRDGYFLVIKLSNNHPYCVKLNSEQRLLAHNWITAEEFTSLHSTSTSVTTSTNKIPTLNKQNDNMSSNSLRNEISNHVVTEIAPANVTFAAIINASNLGNGSNNLKPSQHYTRFTLPPVNITTTIASTIPGVIKILSVDMSPNPLKIGDVPKFALTYENISNRSVTVIGGCYSSLFYTITRTSNVLPQSYPGPSCGGDREFIKQNQIVEDWAIGFDDVYHSVDYKVIKNGTLNVYMTLNWSLLDTPTPEQMSKVNFTLNVPP